QLWMKNEEVINLKMLLKENDELIENLTKEMDKLEAAHFHLKKKLMDAEHNRVDQLWIKNEEIFKIKMQLREMEERNEIISALKKEVMEVEHSREDQLWRKNEEVFDLKMLLEVNEGGNKNLQKELERLRAPIVKKAGSKAKKTFNEVMEKKKNAEAVDKNNGNVAGSANTESRIVYLSKKGGNDLGLVVNITEDSSVIVGQVIPGGTSDQLGGMEEGDEIVSVNGRRLKGDSIHSDYDFIKKLQGKIIFEVRKNHEQALLPKTQYAL
ncbi:hypothetical protein PENTCL1PPCAC_11030, partial [Pristionchus entomophagus]